jgi:FeS assembly SUF system protein
MDATEASALHDKIIAEVLRNCYDPEIPVNIHDLGLIYELKVEESGEVHVKMTLTAPSCPVAGMLVMEVQDKIKQLAGVKDVKVELVWDPPWDISRMSEAARLQLGLM